MKKILLFLGSIFILVGCDNLMNTPTKKVEEFLNKYQTANSVVLDQLDYSLDTSYTFNDSQKERYKDLMKKQYKDLVYTIKDETVDGDLATVKVEIEVYDYSNAIKEADNYLISNQDEFVNQDGTISGEKYLDFKIEKMEDVKDRVKYTLELTLHKDDGTWVMNDITEFERQKISGIYSY